MVRSFYSMFPCLSLWAHSFLMSLSDFSIWSLSFLSAPWMPFGVLLLLSSPALTHSLHFTSDTFIFHPLFFLFYSDIEMGMYIYTRIYFIFPSICKDPPSPSSWARWEPSPQNTRPCMETMSNNNVGQMKEATTYDLYEERELCLFGLNTQSLSSNLFYLKESALCNGD